MAMILKIIGAVMVLISASLAGLFYSGRDGFQAKDLAEMSKALSVLKAFIFSKTPLDVAFKQISKRINQPLAAVFEQIGQRLSDRESLKSAWKESFISSKDVFFDNEDMDLILSFGTSLGETEAMLQTENIDNLIGYLEEKIKKLSQSRSKNQKLFLNLGVLGGFLIVIILF